MEQTKAAVSKLYSRVSSHRIFIKYPSAKQFTKFVIVGFSNVAIDFSVYLILTRETQIFSQHLLAANIISFLIATANSFYWNKFWTFRDQNKNYRTQYVKFFIVSTGGLIIAQLIFVLGVQYLNIFDMLVKSFAVVAITFWNFFINKWWTFKK